MTTIQIKDVLRHDAKTACKANGIKVAMKHMVLLEYSANEYGVSYVMFRDCKTGKEYQCYANWKNYTSEHPSKWLVEEYKNQ